MHAYAKRNVQVFKIISIGLISHCLAQHRMCHECLLYCIAAKQ